MIRAHDTLEQRGRCPPVCSAVKRQEIFTDPKMTVFANGFFVVKGANAVFIEMLSCLIRATGGETETKKFQGLLLVDRHASQIFRLDRQECTRSNGTFEPYTHRC